MSVKFSLKMEDEIAFLLLIQFSAVIDTVWRSIYKCYAYVSVKFQYDLGL